MNPNIKQLLIVLTSSIVIGFISVAIFNRFYSDDRNNDPIVEENINDEPEPVDSGATTSNSVTNTPNARGNLTLEDIKNTTYILNQKEVIFKEGRGVFGGGMESKIKLFAFGDINADGNGDSVVVTETGFVGTTTSKAHDFFVVINNGGLAKSLKINPVVDSQLNIKIYKDVNISDGKIILSFVTESIGTATQKEVREVFKLVGNMLVKFDDRTVWKKYKNDEFGFEFLYPEGSPIAIRPIFENGRDVQGSIYISVTLPFLTSYNTWTKKSLTIYVKKESCPYRNDAKIINRNAIEFHEYAPNTTETSNTETNSLIKELMAFHDINCFTLVSKIEGPGPLSPDFPKATEARSPDNLENFLKLESLILEQILDTFKFI